jgi:hypothetical protein
LTLLYQPHSIFRLIGHSYGSVVCEIITLQVNLPEFHLTSALDNIMELIVNETTVSNSASEEDIISALRGLEVEGFAILQIDNWNYIQVVKDEDDEFMLEYQEGDLSKHYNIVNNPALSTNTVIQMFIQYMNNDEAWKTPYEWEKTVF